MLIGAVAFTAVVPQVWPLEPADHCYVTWEHMRTTYSRYPSDSEIQRLGVAVWAFTSPQKNLETGYRV